MSKALELAKLAFLRTLQALEIDGEQVFRCKKSRKIFSKSEFEGEFQEYLLRNPLSLVENLPNSKQEEK